MVPLSWFMKKNWNLNLGKKSSFCIENGTFYLKLSVIKLKSSIFSTKWTFFRQVQISIFLHKSTQWDHRRLLHKFQKGIFFFTCVWICAYVPISVKSQVFSNSDSHHFPNSHPKKLKSFISQTTLVKSQRLRTFSVQKSLLHQYKGKILLWNWFHSEVFPLDWCGTFFWT